MVVYAIVAKVAAFMGLLSGGTLIVAQTSIVPEGFQSWPVTAMLAFITLTCLAIVCMCMTKLFKTISSSAEAQAKVATELGETNTRLNEMAQKHGTTNEGISNLVAELRARPCIITREKDNA